jgi:hypothetical protein
MHMTGPSPLAFPSSRTLAGWWRQLAAWQPRALSVGHLLFHRVEALVERTENCRPDPLDLLLLKALALFPGETVERIDERLHVEPQLLHRLLHTLVERGLAEQSPPGWTPTPLGRQAIETGEYRRPIQERRSFHFLAPELAGRSPHFIHLRHGVTAMPWQAGEEWTFDARLLQACIDQSGEWKGRHGFPLDVERILIAASSTATVSSWQQVVLDRPERLVAALVLTAGAGGESMLGFAVRQEGWILQTEQPAFTLGQDWRSVYPEFVDEMREEEWRQAWRAWCQPRGLSGVSGEAGSFKSEGHQLVVSASARLMDKLRSSKNEALRDEAWVLAGGGRIRRAALLKVIQGDL